MKIACGPAWASPFVWTRFTETALNLRHPSGTTVKWIFGKGWCPARRHADLCEKALNWGADLIVFLGADQVYPDDLLERLISRFQQGYAVVSAPIPCRGYFEWNRGMKPFQPMAWRWTPNVDTRKYRGQHLDPEMIEIVPMTGEMERVNFIGSGVLMFPAQILSQLKRPWFKETIDPETFQRFANQDCVFVWRLQEELGMFCWVDTSIDDVKHIHPFEIDRSFQDRFDDWMTPEGGGDPSIIQFNPAVVQSTEP